MLETGSWLWRWLADQPPFVEVRIGTYFIGRGGESGGGDAINGGIIGVPLALMSKR